MRTSNNEFLYVACRCSSTETSQLVTLKMDIVSSVEAWEGHIHGLQ
jgi:hypothetical protein